MRNFYKDLLSYYSWSRSLVGNPGDNQKRALFRYTRAMPNTTLACGTGMPGRYFGLITSEAILDHEIGRHLGPWRTRDAIPP